MKNTMTAVQLPHTQATCQHQSTGTIKKKIGNTVYRVSVHFSDTSKERIEDKILRMVSNDVSSLSNIVTNKAKNSLKNDIDCGIMNLPQTGRLLEGGSFS